MPAINPCLEFPDFLYSDPSRQSALVATVRANMPQQLVRHSLDDDIAVDNEEATPLAKIPTRVAGGESVQTQIDELFHSLAETWKRDTLTSSSFTNVAMHPSYQRVIGLGPKAVPLILQDLLEGDAPWFWALRALTGENPVPPEHRGNISLMTDDWLKWGREHGHL